jgi:hypothetical protein
MKRKRRRGKRISGRLGTTAEERSVSAAR